MKLTSCSALTAVVVLTTRWVGLLLLMGVALGVEGLWLDLDLLSVDNRVVVVFLLLREGRRAVCQPL